MCHESWQGEAGAATPVTFPAVTGDSAGMPGWRYPTVGAGRGTCLVVPDIFGPSPFYHEITRRLGAHGYRAVLVDYFHRQGPLAERDREAAFARRADLDEELTLRELSAAVDRLRQGGTGRRVAVLGFCLSGQFALDLAAYRDDLATVCFYAFPEGVGAPAKVTAPRPIDLAHRISGPILAAWGRQDYIGLPVISRFGAAMREHGVDYTPLLYDDAGHGFLQGLVEPRGDSAAAADAWQRVLGFLDRSELVR